jgi:uncharacterized lipoprotein YddW (UPF0748 family)
MSLPRDFGYDPFTVELYRKDTGKAPPANPDDPAWVSGELIGSRPSCNA